MKAGKGCLTVIGGLVVLFIVIGVIAAATQKSSNGPTRSPALVTGSGNTGTSSKPKASAHTQTFAGNGSENLGTIHVSTLSTLRWSCSSCAHNNFIVESDLDDSFDSISLNALGPSHGKTAVDAGTYRNVQVTTEGQAWTLRIVPGTG